VIRILVAVGMIASAFHFGDNAWSIARYPEPAWITPAGVVGAWCVATALGAVALLRRRRDLLFFTSAGLYALVLASGLLHYCFGSPLAMPLRSNLTVLAEGITGAALAVALIAGRSKQA
jgi:NO-binding membrane sensor protein with MHYT domain